MPAPPPVAAITLTYCILGAALSYTFGRDPASGEPLIPNNSDDLVLEIAPTAIVICLFLVSYSLIDVLNVGIVKIKLGLADKPYHPDSSSNNPPEELYLAIRAQMNQVEQLPGFLIASICFTILVNGKVGAVLSLIWAILRRLYASTYCGALVKPITKAGITKYTIPAYFIVNSMLLGVVVQCGRILAYKL